MCPKTSAQRAGSVRSTAMSVALSSPLGSRRDTRASIGRGRKKRPSLENHNMMGASELQNQLLPGLLTLSFHVLFSQRQKRPCLALETQNSTCTKKWPSLGCL